MRQRLYAAADFAPTQPGQLIDGETRPESPATTATGQTRRPATWVIFAITVTGITFNTMITASIPEILRGLNAPLSLAGVLIGAGTLPGVLVAPMIGVLADRFGRRRVVLPCMVVFAVAGGLGTLAPNLWVLVGLRLVQGAASLGLINLVIVIIGDHWEGIEQSTMIGRNSAVLTTCLAVFPFIGGALTDLGSWRTPFLVYPVALLTAGLVARRLPASRHNSEVTVREQVTRLVAIIRHPRVATLLGATVAAFALIFGAILTVLPIYTEVVFDLPATYRGLILGIPAIGSTTASLLLGRATGRLGRRRLLTAAVVVGGAALVVIGVAPTLVVLGAGAVLWGLFEGTIIPSLQDMAANAGGSTDRGSTVSAMVGAARLGQTVGPLGLSALFGMFGATTTYATAAAVTVFVLLPLLRYSAGGGDPQPAATG